jgi:predicted dehydrogenase
LAIAAARAGKHIFIEKPLALSLQDAVAVAQAVRETGVTLMPAFKFRFYPLVRMARDFIGKPQVVVGQMMDEPLPDDHWALDPIEGGGNMATQGCHAIDLLRFFTGSEPEVLWATGGSLTHVDNPCIDQCIASLRFRSGAIASWITGDAGMGTFTGKYIFELFGEGRSVQLYDRLRKATFNDGERAWTQERSQEEGFALENEEFINVLRENREPEVTVEDGLQATRLILAAEQAVRTGAVQRLG